MSVSTERELRAREVFFAEVHRLSFYQFQGYLLQPRSE